MDTPLISLRHNGVVVAKQRRDDEEAWQGARSWLGGLPHIRLADWPRHRLARTPLFHIAQINFADFPAGPWSSLLPEKGALCFFFDVDTFDEKPGPTVVYVPDPEKAPPCQPPDDCEPIGGKDTGIWEGEQRDPMARYGWARWPVDLVAVTCERHMTEEEGPEVTYDPSLDAILGPHPDYVRTPPPEGRRIAPVCQEDEVPWDAARRVVFAVQNNARFVPSRDLPPGMAAKLKDVAWGARHRQEAIRGFVDYWEPLIAQNDPYTTMTQEQAELFIANIWTLRRGKALGRWAFSHTQLTDAGCDVYRDMMLGERAVYEKMPPHVRDRIQNEWLKTPTDGTHQVFGIGRDLQGELSSWDDHFLLFQATFDYMMDWQWGDLGVVQFWIKPEDLAARNWGGVRSYYTCG